MGEEAFFIGPTTWLRQVVMGASYNAHAALMTTRSRRDKDMSDNKAIK